MIPIKTTFMLELRLNRSNNCCMSMRDCLISLYTVPRKLRGIESWNTRPLIITKSPTVSVPKNGEIR